MRETSRSAAAVRRSAALGMLALALPVALAAPHSAVAEDPAAAEGLYLVTLQGPGTAGHDGPRPRAAVEQRMRAEQSAVLGEVGDPTPVYRWTAALNGVAVHLSDTEARELAGDPRVALVEENAVRPLAGRGPQVRDASARAAGPAKGGAGTVVGFVDSGLAPGGPLFTAGTDLGREPPRYRGGCVDGAGWDAADCTGKVVGAQWFVDGFGEADVRATAMLSARDTDGHGTQMTSIAAGNAGVSVRVDGESLGRFGGLAPQARIAVYKACWSAPDPRDDGCATADLVAAIDQATADRVDVLSLSVGGPSELDTVERALLGATESGAVVTAAAGNDGTDVYAAHPSPWVTTVGGTGATRGPGRLGRVVTDDGPRLAGAMVARRGVGPARLVAGARVPTPTADRGAARVCAPGSLDAAEVTDAVVLCERGRVGRVDKSRAVELAGGVGMVLANSGPGSVYADFHSVPTVHVDQRQGRILRRWAERHPSGTVTLRPDGRGTGSAPAVAPWSSRGDPTAGVLKPDLLAPASGVLGAVPDGWDFVSGTSAATAHVAGVAATLLGRTGWSATTVRSALSTTSASVLGPTLATGAGRVRAEKADRPGLVYAEDVAHYRSWLEGRRRDLNTASVLLSGGEQRAQRTVTNLADRSLYYSSAALGFRGAVTVTPAALRLDPGESATFTVTVTRSGSDADDGEVVWRGATGTVTRIPVLIAR